MATRKRTVIEPTKSEKVRNFELIVITSPEIDESGLESRVESINQFVTSHGGTMADIERWGRKKLAYPLDRFLEGNYVITTFQMNASACRELDESLKIAEDVLRHMLIRQD